MPQQPVMFSSCWSPAWSQTAAGWHVILQPFIACQPTWLCWSPWHEQQTQADPTSVQWGWDQDCWQDIPSSPLPNSAGSRFVCVLVIRFSFHKRVFNKPKNSSYLIFILIYKNWNTQRFFFFMIKRGWVKFKKWFDFLYHITKNKITRIQKRKRGLFFIFWDRMLSFTGQCCVEETVG